MSRHPHPASAQQHGQSRRSDRPLITVQLSLSGVLGIGAVLFCLFLWMFLLGIWAGQTLLAPQTGATAAPARSSAETHRPAAGGSTEPELEPVPVFEGVLLLPSERKRRINPPE